MSNIAIVCGGYSGERVISNQSADVVLESLENAPFNCFKVWIDQKEWKLITDGGDYPIDKNDFTAQLNGDKISFDGVFNTIHGTPGEDGLLQGYFDLLGIPYNTCDVYSSAITFNKGACNRLLKDYGIRSATSVILKKDDERNFDRIAEKTGIPCFVKPNGSGSSLGISKVNSVTDLPGALDKAFEEDEYVVVETFIEGTEITCGAVMRNGRPQGIAVTEIVCETEFFDYEAKYHDKRTQEITPARIDQVAYDDCMRTTERIYSILQCQGIIRADYILSGSELYLIEVNTTPGLSSASLIPQQVRYAGQTLESFFTEEVKLVLQRR